MANNHPDWERHPHLIGDVILVLDLGLGERGLLHHRPHHRLGAAVERAVGGEFHHLAGDLRLGGKIHGGIAAFPVALDAQALELVALHLEPILREGAALGAERDHWRGVDIATLLGSVEFAPAFSAPVLLDLPLDRQAVAVPARHVVGVVAEHLLRARHHVLEHLVERGADVDVAVGVGRAVMQDEARPPLGGLAQAPVHGKARPAREQLGLLLRQPGAHRKGRLRQEQRCAVVAGFLGHGGSISSA